MTVLAAILLIGSFSLSVTLTAIVRRISSRIGFVAHPSADRYHRNVVPLGGGIAIFAVLMTFIIAGTAAIKFLVLPGYLGTLAETANVKPTDFFARIDELTVLSLCVLLLFLLGLLDDRKSISPFIKLAVQFAIAIIATTLAEIRIEFFIENKFITLALSAFWIVFIINAFNFLDNMDGASAGIAAIASSILFIAATTSGQVFVGGLALVFIGTLLGFLVFNFPPARIFMGDAGSLVVGFLVAVLTLRTTYYHQAKSGSWYPVFLPLIVMAVPLYDFISVTALRISQGKSPFIGDTQHFSHRLNNRGLTQTQTVLTLYLATLCTGLSAVFLYQVNFTGAILIFAQSLFILAIIAILETTSRNERTPD